MLGARGATSFRRHASPIAGKQDIRLSRSSGSGHHQRGDTRAIRLRSRQVGPWRHDRRCTIVPRGSTLRPLMGTIVHSAAKRRGSRFARGRVRTGATVVRFSRPNAVCNAVKRVATVPSVVGSACGRRQSDATPQGEKPARDADMPTKCDVSLTQ